MRLEGKSSPDTTDGALAAEPHLGTDVVVGLALGAGEDEPGTLSQGLGGLSAGYPSLKGLSFGWAEYQRRQGSSSRHERLLSWIQSHATLYQGYLTRDTSRTLPNSLLSDNGL